MNAKSSLTGVKKTETGSDRELDKWSCRPVTGAERYTSYISENIHVFELGGKLYGWSPVGRAACELTQPAAAILSFLNDEVHTFEEIDRKVDSALSVSETGELLDSLESLGFLRKIEKHCTPISSINLLLTTNCNMDCLYCYGGKGKDGELPGGSYSLKKEQMSPDIGFAAVDYLLKASSPETGRYPGGINFFGGEPLLNIGTMRAILEYAEEQSIKFGFDLPRFSITTNGTMMTDEFIELCHRYNIGVQVSFDGTREAQNTNRPFRGGNGESSYEMCCLAFERLRRNRIQFRVRATISRHNSDILQAIKSFDALKVPRVHFAIVNADDSSGVTLREEDIDELITGYEKIAEYMLGRIRAARPYVRCNNLTGMLETIQNKREKSYCCGAGIGLISVVPDGRMFLCHRFAGEDDFCLGHIKRGINFTARRGFISQMNIESSQFCRECWCRDLCGGGCPYSNYLHSRTLHQPDSMECRLQKGLAQVAIHFASCLRKENEEYYWQLVSEN